MSEEGRERERIERVYGGYKEDRRRGRAWSASNPGNVAIREEVIRTLLERAPGVLEGNGLVLDAGCGTGWWLERVTQAGVAQSRLVGVDVLEERVRTAAERVPGARVVAGDIRNLPVQAGACSLVMLFTVLSAMGSSADGRIALGEARRVLAPGGVIAIWEPRIWTPNPHTRLVGLGELRAALGKQMRVYTITLAPPLARRVGSRVYQPLARIAPLRTHRLVLARF
jgi:ubiquinone/menaquinone biosynthesis C-methylase UbiE